MVFVFYSQHDSRDVPVRLIIGASGGTKIPTSVAQGEIIKLEIVSNNLCFFVV